MPLRNSQAICDLGADFLGKIRNRLRCPLKTQTNDIKLSQSRRAISGRSRRYLLNPVHSIYYCINYFIPEHNCRKSRPCVRARARAPPLEELWDRPCEYNEPHSWSENSRRYMPLAHSSMPSIGSLRVACALKTTRVCDFDGSLSKAFAVVEINVLHCHSPCSCSCTPSACCAEATKGAAAHAISPSWLRLG